MWERALLDTVPSTLEHKPPSKRHAFTADTRFEVCPFHEIKARCADCRMFRSLDMAGKEKVLREKGLCLNCFGRHLRRHCKKKLSCTTSGCKRNHHSLLHKAIAQRRTTSGCTNTALNPGEELNATSNTTAVPSVTAQQQNTASSANELQQGIAGMFSARVATSGLRVVHQIVPVFL